MKLAALFIVTVILSLNSFGQTEPSKKLPPIKMLPKKGEVKHIYELPAPSAYKIYDIKGNLIAEGNAEFIDYTEYKKGIYFIAYADKKEKFERK